MSSDNCLRCHWSVRLQSYLAIPGLIVSLELEVSFEAGCLLQHLRLAAVDQSGLKVGVSVLLLLLLVVLWFQQLGEVSF